MMLVKKTSYIVVKTQFEFIHKYENAPEEVKYLREPHRHIFYVEAKIQVYNNDRELEFILVKHDIDKFLQGIVSSAPITYSCEMFAEDISNFLIRTYAKHINRNIEVSVFEDNENGAQIVIESGE